MASFAVAVQWTRGGIVVQEDGLTCDEALDAVQGYMGAARHPYRVGFALVTREGACRSE